MMSPRTSLGHPKQQLQRDQPRPAATGMRMPCCQSCNPLHKHTNAVFVLFDTHVLCSTPSSMLPQISFDQQHITTAEGSHVRVFEVGSLNQVKSHRMPAPAESASLCWAKRKFVAGGEDMWVHLYDLDTCQVRGGGGDGGGGGEGRRRRRGGEGRGGEGRGGGGEGGKRKEGKERERKGKERKGKEGKGRWRAEAQFRVGLDFASALLLGGRTMTGTKV